MEINGLHNLGCQSCIMGREDIAQTLVTHQHFYRGGAIHAEIHKKAHRSAGELMHKATLSAWQKVVSM